MHVCVKGELGGRRSMIYGLPRAEASRLSSRLVASRPERSGSDGSAYDNTPSDVIAALENEFNYKVLCMHTMGTGHQSVWTLHHP